MKNNINRCSAIFILILILGVGQLYADTWLYGSFQNWVAKDDSYKFSYDGDIGTYYLELDAATEYEFKIIDGDNYYSMNNANFTTTTTDYLIHTGNGNCKITTGEAGVYVFKTWWADNNRHFSIYFPQARLKKQTYIYFDARMETNWQENNPDIRYWYKYYDSGIDVGSVDCNKSNALENWVYYALVPDNDYVGRIQLNRLNPSDHSKIWCSSEVTLAKDRTSSAQNCLKEESGKENYCNSWTPQWTTYCPPISSVTMADNGSTLYGGDGSAGTPYLIEAGDPIKVHVTEAVSAVNDGNMTVNYQFKDGASNIGDEGTSDEATKTSGSSGTTHTIIVEARNKYNGAAGTLAKCTLYYETKTVYTGLSVAKSGDDSKASAPAISQSWAIATNSVTVTATIPDGYRFTGWTSSNGSFADASALNTTFTPTADNAVATATYALRWAISTSYDDWSTDDHIIGNISTSAGVTSGYVAITLPANTNYGFKILDKTNHWLGYATEGTSLTYSNSGTAYAMAEGNYDLYFTTAGAGSYRFTWDITNSKVSVTYPTSYTVTYDGNGKTSGDVPSVLYYAANATVTVAAAPDSWGKSGYTFGGWNTANDGSGSNYTAGTETFSITADTTLYAKWTQDISLDRESGTSGSTTVTATYNSATLGSYTNPERSGYTFGGYYSGDDGTGQLIINTSKQLQANKTDGVVYTGANGIWKHDGATTLYAKWTANPYTVTLNNLEADVAGTTSVDVTYDATTGLTSAITKPEKTHYDFGGYYTSNDEGVTLGTQLIDENGNWKKSISGYTGEDGNNPTWVYAGNLTLYAKWTEHEYAITIAVTGSGSTSPASSTTAKYVTASGDISAIPASGYSFRDWDFSKTDAVNDIYCADTYTSTSNPVHIHAVHDGTLTANFTANGYTVTLEDLDADEGHKGTSSVSVTYDTTTNLTSSITCPQKTHYEFGGYWTSTNRGSTLTTQLIDENGYWIKDVSGYTSHSGDNPTWVCAGDTVLYAMWTETSYTITPSVSPAGAGSVNTVTDAHLVTPSSTITATPANAAWTFDYWEYGEHVGYASGSGNAITVTASQNSTITAHFKPRFSLVGSLYEGDEGGMPGWEDYTKTFAVNSTSPMDLTRTCILQANKTYKVEVHDNATGTNLGRSGCDPVCVLEENASLLMENSNNDVFLYTSGAGEYIFKITAIDGSDHPTLTVLRPYPVNFGQKYLDIDGALHTGTTGGTAAATAGSALSSGDYVTYNTSVTHTATPAGGYTFAGWWSSDAFEGDRFSNDNPMTYAVTSGDNAYAKFIETSTSVTLANDGNGHVTIGGNTETSTTCGVTTTRELTAVPNDGYMFSSWTKTSGDDITISSTSTNPTTLSGNGSGATSGQTVTANFVERYSIKGTMNGENWGTTHTLSNIGRNANSKDTCYVTMTLPANTTYEFAIYDEHTKDWYKAGTDAVYYMTYTNHTNWEFGGTKTHNCGITTAGKGAYKFIFNITDKTVTVVYPTSYQVNYGASVGGSVTSVVDGDGNAVPNGGYVSSGGSVTYTAAANDGYSFVGWCNNDSYGDTFNTDLSWTNSDVTETQNSFAKFKSTNFVIYRTGDMSSDPRAAYDDVESYAGGTISEAIEFRMKVRELDKWYTLCLPFTVNAVKVWDEEDAEYYDLVPYYRTAPNEDLHGGHYIIRSPKTATNLAITEFDDWYDPISSSAKPAKDTPYIIQWHMSYFDGMYISFFGASGQSIPTEFSAGSAPSNDNVVNVYGNNSMRSGSVAGAYLLENDYGSDGAWIRSENVSEYRTILPFECYIRANDPTTTKYRILHRDMDINGETGWEDVINSESKAQITVYTMSGFRVTQFKNCSFDQAARQLRKTFNEGLFIFCADNESVKVMLGGK